MLFSKDSWHFGIAIFKTHAAFHGFKKHFDQKVAIITTQLNFYPSFENWFTATGIGSFLFLNIFSDQF